MARVGVLDVHQEITDKPAEFVKKNVAQAWVRRLTHRRISRHLIQRVIIKSTELLMREAAVNKRYIPERLPPREVPGVFFQPPQNDQWKILHRTVKFLPREA